MAKKPEIPNPRASNSGSSAVSPESLNQEAGSIQPPPTVQKTPTYPLLQFVNEAGPKAKESNVDNRKSLVRKHAASYTHARARLQQTTEYQRQRSLSKGMLAEREQGSGSGSTLSNVLGTGRIDPFASYAVQCTPFEHSLLDHYVKIVIPESVNHHFSPIDNKYGHKMLTSILPFTITDPGMMNGVFLLACRDLASRRPENTYTLEAVRYKGECIRSLAESIKSEGTSITDATVMKALFLASDEFYTGNLTGTKAHAEALGRMVRLKGGLEKLGLEGQLQRLVLWNDRASTFYTGDRPNFMHLVEFLETAITESLTPGFLRYYRMGIFSLDMISILNDACAVTDRINNPHDGPNRQKELLKLIQDKEFDSRLLTLSADYRCPVSSRFYTWLEDFLSLSLIIYVSRFPSKNHTQIFAREYLAYRMKNITLRLMRELDWRNYADILLWITVLAGFLVDGAEGVHFPGPTTTVELPVQADLWLEDTFPVIRTLLRDSARALKIKSIDDLKRVLVDFAWVESDASAAHLARAWRSNGRSIVDGSVDT